MPYMCVRDELLWNKLLVKKSNTKQCDIVLETWSKSGEFIRVFIIRLAGHAYA